MARNNKERYVRYYTFGSAVPRVEEQRAVLPKDQAKRKREPLPMDPVAVFGNAVAILLAILMLVGLAQATQVASEVRAVQTQIQILELEKQMLQEQYENGYDLEEIRSAAASMGMIPVSEAVRVSVEVPTVEELQVQRVSWWDSLLVSLRQIFA